MKKYFIFAAVAAAGLFASCSSSDDITANDVQNPIEDPDAPQAIRLNLAKPGAMITRGTGTVGGVGTAATQTAGASANYMPNTWAGQSINVFMFTKGDGIPAVYFTQAEIEAAQEGDDAYGKTTNDIKTPAVAATDEHKTVLNLTQTHDPGATTVAYLYNNTEMITPGSSENLIPGEDTDNDGSGEAMIKDGTINYYPPQGNFDFFGYHGDDAVATTATISRWDSNGDEIASATESYADDALWTVPFEINGTQDLMSTKAELTGDQTNIMGADANANPRFKDYFSAYAARKQVHPTLTFQHLLTRLQFNVIAGNKSAAGWVDATNAVNYSQAECDEYNATLGGHKSEGDLTNIYTFTSYVGETDQAPYYSGKAEILSESEGYTKVKVIANSVASFIGNEYAVHQVIANLSTAGTLELLTPDTHQSLNPKIFVKGFENQALTAAEANAYNATLPGARTTATEKTSAQAAHVDPLKAVKVQKIEVLSENTKGNLAVAWTTDLTNPEKIAWDAPQPAETSRWLTLMDRPEYQKKDGAAAAEVADFTDLTAQQTALNAQKAALQAELALITDQSSAAYTAKQAEITAVSDLIDDLSDEATDREAAKITAETYALLTAAAQTAKYEPIENSVSEKLIALTPTSPKNADNSTTFSPVDTPVGESIILSPGKYDANGVAQIGDPLANTQKLRMKVTLAQNVPTNWNHPEVLTEKIQNYELDIKAPDGGFKQNTSYNIKLTVYGLERIEVIAVVEPWGDGGDIAVGADE